LAVPGPNQMPQSVSKRCCFPQLLGHPRLRGVLFTPQCSRRREPSLMLTRLRPARTLGLTCDRIQGLQRLASRVAENLEELDGFQTGRRIIEELDVQVRLTVGAGEEVICAHCVVGARVCRLSINSTRPIWQSRIALFREPV
jgi:hypothetical protein